MTDGEGRIQFSSGDHGRIRFDSDTIFDYLDEDNTRIFRESLEGFNGAETHVKLTDVAGEEIRSTIIPLSESGECWAVAVFPDSIFESFISHCSDELALTRSILDSTPDRVSVVSSSYEYVWMNKAQADSANKAREDLLGKVCHVALGQGDSPCERCRLGDVVETGEPFHNIVKRSNGVIWDTVREPLFGADGKVEAVVNFSRDITKSYLHQERLRALHRNVVELSEADTVGDVLGLSISKISQALGFNLASIMLVEGRCLRVRETTTGKPDEGVSILPLDGKGITVRACRERRSQLVSDTRCDPDFVSPEMLDEYKPLSELAVPIMIGDEVLGVIDIDSPELKAFDEGDAQIVEIFAGHLASALRVLQQKSSQEEFKDRLIALQRHASELGVAHSVKDISDSTCDAIGRFIDFNTGSFALVDGDVLRHEFFWNVDFEPLVMSLGGDGVTVAVVNTGVSQNIGDASASPSFVAGYSNQDYSVVSELAVPVKVGGKVIAVINIESGRRDAFSDEDQRLLEIYAEHIAPAMERLKQIERFNSAQEAHTEELLKGADRVTSMLRHDLRGPLSTIKNAVYIMQQGMDEKGEMIDIVNKSVDYAVSMLEDLRNVTRSSEPVKLPIELNMIMGQVVKDAFIPEEIKVEMDLAEGLPEVEIDIVKVRRVLDNLIRNSVEAMPDGGALRIHTELVDGEAVVTVEDTGTGIPDEIRGRLFQPFATSKPKGMGLGLAFCKQTVEAHGGRIWVETGGGGTTFSFSLPLRNV